MSWLLYVLRPDWSYASTPTSKTTPSTSTSLVAEHPEWEANPYDVAFTADYGTFQSVADLFRQIGHDERIHKEGSIAALASPRFS